MTHVPSRIAIYARYSSDLQNPTSVDDQVSHCMALIERQFGVTDRSKVRTFSDCALSGATMARPGLKAMLGEAKADTFDLLIAEGLDRLSRSLKDIADIFERLRYHGVAIWTAHEGSISSLHVGMKGTMNELYLEDMRAKVRRGQKARIEAGYAASSPPYGYRVVRGVVDDKMRNVNGLREIYEPEAAVVRRIFEQFTEGMGTREIVRRLNDEGILSPGGKQWHPARLLGSRARGEGVLRNEHYRGWLVYNRTRLVTDPGTGRKRYVPNPPEDWSRREVPDLRIVSEDIWRAVRERDIPRQWATRCREPARDAPPGEEKAGFRYNQRPLTGLVKCGVCGGQKNIANDTRYLCSTNRYSRKCVNARGTRERVICDRLFEVLRATVCHDEAFPAAVRQACERECAERERNLGEIGEIDERIGRLLEAIERGVSTDRVTAKICALQKRQGVLRRCNGTLITEVPSDEDIRLRTLRGLDRLEAVFFHEGMAVSLHLLFCRVVREIVLAPVPGRASGETVTIALKPGGWAELWRFACGLLARTL